MRFSICFVSLQATGLLTEKTSREMIGGAEVQQVLLATEFAKRGIETAIVVAPDQDLPPKLDGVSIYQAYDSNAGLPVARILYPRAYRLWRALARANSDVYYTRGAKVESFLVYLYCKLARKRLIQAVAHNDDCSPETLRALPRRLTRLAYLVALRRAHLVVAQSKEQQSLLETHMHRCSVIVKNVTSILASVPRMNTRCEHLLWVGSIKPSKRPEWFLRLAMECPSLRFTMIASRANSHRAVFDSLQREATLIPNLEFLGYQPFRSTESAIQRADVVIITSNSEGFPNVMLQAWAARRLVISAFDPDGLLSRDGLGIAISSYENLVHRTKELSSMAADDIQDIVDRAYTYVREHHSPNVVVASLSHAIASLLPPRDCDMDGPSLVL